MGEITKLCNDCGEVKSRDEFGNARLNKDGKESKCKVCRRLQQKESYTKRKGKKQITGDNRSWYQLGILKGLEGINDVKKALATMEKANRALLEVINTADLRDKEA